MDLLNSDSTFKPSRKPRTEKQIAASRENGKKSKGPKTQQGKAISSRNGLRFGLLASVVVQGVESRRQFRDLIIRLSAQYQPVGVIEEVLLEEIAVAIWSLRRARKDETTALNEFYHGSGDYPVFDHSSAREQKARKALYSSMERLTAVQAERKQNHNPEDDPAADGEEVVDRRDGDNGDNAEGGGGEQTDS